VKDAGAGIGVILFGTLLIFLGKLFSWLLGRGEKRRKKKGDSDHRGGFLINYQMRRRRLDMTREGHSFSTDVGKKLKKQRKGMTNRRGRKK